MITLIAAIGRNGELGLDNKLLWNIPEDMKHFKSYTMGKVIVMGSNTFASIGNKPLPGRKCIVVSSGGLAGMAIRAKNIDDVFSIDHCYPEIVIIGGASVYRQTIDRADKLVITHVDAEFKADTFFPTIDLTSWKINSTIDGSNETYSYKFVEYIRNESIRDIE
jgi:dihydrofolate reductase